MANTIFSEPTISKTRAAEDNPNCTEYFIAPEAKVSRSPDSTWQDSVSRWEELRTRIVQGMHDSLPQPIEGPILPIKDKRAAVVADIHTDGKNKVVLEEGTGVPRVIFVAVKDANGPRLTIGLTYSHYEFTVPDGQRMTDEDWQSKLYSHPENNSQILYQPKSSWPDVPLWYRPLLGTK